MPKKSVQAVAADQPHVAPADQARARLFEQLRAELASAREKSFEQFDSAILTLSSGGLAVSLAFVKDIVPLATSAHKWLLLTSWGLFSSAIISTLFSFLLSQAAIDRHLADAGDYYLNGMEDALTRTNPFAKATTLLNRFSALLFVGAVLATVLFASVNL